MQTTTPQSVQHANMPPTSSQTPAERAVEAVMASDKTAAACIHFIEELFKAEVEQANPDVGRLSICLGAVELPLTVKQEALQRWPEDLQQQVAACVQAFDAFVLQMHQKLQPASDSRGKVKQVADAIWSKLTGSFSKDILHAQHIFNFAAMLLPGGAPKGKRQLDCAGVVTTTLAVCQQLARRHGHEDLQSCSMQVSEDHCWLTLDPSDPSARSSVEVTTDTPAKRGLPASDDAWAGWLYTGGCAVLCCPRRAVAALVNSLNPAVTTGKNGRDSEQMQALQHRLLSLLWREHPSTIYPAALCNLADLEEVALQDELDAALEARDQAKLDSLLHRVPGDPQQLFERAVAMAAGWGLSGETGGCEEGASFGTQISAAEPGPAAAACSAALGGAPGPASGKGAEGAAAELGSSSAADGQGISGAAAFGRGQAKASGGAGSSNREQVAAAPAPTASEAGDPGWQWYPYSYLGGYLARRAEFLSQCAAAFPGDAARYADAALACLQQALAVFARGAGVLAKYKFAPTDDQLYKDVEGSLEYCRDGLVAAAAAAAAAKGDSSDGALEDPSLLQPLLRLWDGVSCLYAGKPKPAAWVGLVLKVAKLFTAEARAAAAAAEEPRSESMRKANGLWGALKPVAIRPMLESAEVEQGEARAIKRPRR